jgi:Protein of unknown function (DUF3237)
MAELRSRYLFTITMKLPPTLELGDTPAGNRRVFTVSSGAFAGDRLRGEVLPEASSDLLLVRGDGSYQQDVRLVLRTDDSALILMTYRGVRHASPEVVARIARGEQVAPSEYYLRTAPFFETSSSKYAWLNKIVSIGVGEREANSVNTRSLRFFRPSSLGSRTANHEHTMEKEHAFLDVATSNSFGRGHGCGPR